MKPFRMTLTRCGICCVTSQRERLKPGNFKEHIGRLSDEKRCCRSTAPFGGVPILQAPNSPNGTHFVVEVSPWFERIASSKKHERLFALLPYKTLYLFFGKGQARRFRFYQQDGRAA